MVSVVDKILHCSEFKIDIESPKLTVLCGDPTNGCVRFHDSPKHSTDYDFKALGGCTTPRSPPFLGEEVYFASVLTVHVDQNPMLQTELGYWD